MKAALWLSLACAAAFLCTQVSASCTSLRFRIPLLCTGQRVHRVQEINTRPQRADGDALGLRLRGGGSNDDEEGDADQDGGAKMDADDDDDDEDQKKEEDDGKMTISKALRQVLFYSRIHDGVVKGLNEVIKSLERGEAQIVLLAEDCEEAKYVELVTLMCAEKGIYMLKVPERAVLGEMAGQIRTDDEGNVKKSCPASSVAIKDFGEQSEGLAFLLNYIKESGDGGEGAGEVEAENEREAEAEPGDNTNDGGEGVEEGEEEE